ncbi:rsbT co-antagonist protein RsbR [Peribacillus deserti]|uniref:RsbT co-antagonist protein RsbR n=1 Tax=Peribacillus deserti TaxID=673318 RepID=A0ABS2QDB0_9BACI|nr:STAS domain-containing protein [Peribacillus deserti]MBM7691123.1 rsbT co-antagonist protein RsbR [Peribacillus deserti]
MTAGSVTSQPRIKSFRNFDEAAENILQFMSKLIHINTLFVAKNDKLTNQISNVINRDIPLLERGVQWPFEETLCKLSVDKGSTILIIEDLNKSPLAKSLTVTQNLGGGSFIAIPIYYENGENYGTICGLDQRPFEFTNDHIELFENMASVLTYVLELDKANQQINELSVPIVLIAEGVAILPIIGDINEERAEIIIKNTLASSTELSLQYLIIDLSGIVQINDTVGHHLLNIVKMLKLIGVTPVLTGIRPDLAVKAAKINGELSHITIKNNPQEALAHIGFYLNHSYAAGRQ